MYLSELGEAFTKRPNYELKVHKVHDRYASFPQQCTYIYLQFHPFVAGKRKCKMIGEQPV